MPRPWGRGHLRVLRLSDVSVVYNGPKSRTERPRKTKIGTEVAHVTRESDTTFKVNRSTCSGRGHILAASRTACYGCVCSARLTVARELLRKKWLKQWRNSPPADPECRGPWEPKRATLKYFQR